MAEPLGQMMIELGLDDTKFGNGLKNAKSQLKYFGSEMKAQASFYDAFGSKVDGLSAKEQGLTKMIAAQSKAVAESKKAYDGSLTSSGEMTKSSARLAANFEAEQSKLASLAKQYISTAQAEAEMSVKTTGVTGAINKLGTAQIAIGNRMKSLGDSMTTGITVPVATAFVAATAKAIKFQNQLLVIKNLLTTGGESAKEAISGVNKMQSDAIQYSDHYGVSVEKISAGYEELVRRGYTSKQAIAAMKTELQGALASGDDFNDVVSVASSTLESFGMKSNNTATMTRNTKTAVNELAYAADLTATDFQSLGVGMSYVGATAHQAHFTLSETASALGVLSNNGVEADKAGTGLRKVIVSLNTAVKNIGTKNDVLASLGIKKEEIVGSNGQLKSLSTVMDVLNQHTKDMSATKKAAVFNSLFGTTGQQAGIILAQNSKQLAELNSQVDKAEKKNYVGSLSEKNLKSAQNQLKVLQQNVENLGMTLAQKVLPSVQPIIKDLTDAVNWFGKLNPQVQQNIVKWGLLAAAMGPVLSIGGRLTTGLGKLGTSSVGLIAKIAGLGAKSQAAKTVMGQLTDATGNVVGTLTKAGGAATNTGGLIGNLAGRMTVAAGETGVLGSALTPLGLGMIAVAGAAAIGVVAWEGFGKQMVESSNRASRWGSDIGSVNDQAASKFQNMEQQVTTSLNNTSKSASQNAADIDKSFKTMLDDTAKRLSDNSKQVDALAKKIGGLAGSTLEDNFQESEKSKNKALSQMKDYYNQAQAITKNASKNHRDITEDEKREIENLQVQMAESEVKTLGLSSSKQKKVLAALTGDIGKMSSKALLDVDVSMTDALKKSRDSEKSYFAQLKELHDQHVIDDATYYQTRSDLQAQFAETSQQQLIAEARVSEQYAKKTGVSHKQWLAEEKQYLTGTMGLTKSQADAVIDAYEKTEQATNATIISIEKLSGKAKAAAETWNDLVFDPKTGQLKTNAQDEVTKATKNANKWNQIKLLVHEGKMTENGAEMISSALISQKRWDDLKFLEKNAKLNDETKAAIISAMASNNQWNTKDWKTAVLLARDAATVEVIKSLNSMGRWQALDPRIQQMIAQDGTGPAVVSALKQMGLWNGLPEKVKNLLAIDNASYPSKQATDSVNSFPTGERKIKLIAEYAKVYDDSRSWSAADRSAMGFKEGTNDFNGGLAMVNDQKGPTFREAIIHPNGGIEIPFGRNVIRPIEKHAQIVPAGMTARMFPKLPQYANGKDIPANATALSLANQVTQSLGQTSSVTVTNNSDNSNIETLLGSIKALLATLLTRETDFIINGQSVAKIMYPYLDQIQKISDKRQARGRGITS
ncbi:phage tail tape measure protein [Lacticaseibacillus paracasei]|uniref:phage tail tape measure protein n=1 Tax=Lacticaseibacillus paracasei TaxID=1597 RepID=UPI0008DD348D|nr:phage tail tape measure protein [Lacticaseibacillus paracasei]OHY53224.1 phage tail tape measure protein [Lacticaseibacillus paracasei]